MISTPTTSKLEWINAFGIRYLAYHVSLFATVPFQDSRSGKHAAEFLNGWQGNLVCDDYSGYKERFK